MIYNFKQFINENIENDVTKSDNFKRWFSKSIIVDKDNKPKIVYHGSVSKEINIFDLNSKKINRTNNYAGFYFSPDESVAADHSSNGKVYPCYINIQNPIYIGYKYNQKLDTYKKIKYTPSQKSLDYIYDKYKSEFNDNYLLSKLNDLKDRGVCSFMTGEDRRYIAIIDGYDGMIDGSEICAFYPNQIKLADGSNTTFSKNDDNIRK